MVKSVRNALLSATIKTTGDEEKCIQTPLYSRPRFMTVVLNDGVGSTNGLMVQA